jgi:oligosaccharyltransferase complex subunit delta (ribophorin II)
MADPQNTDKLPNSLRAAASPLKATLLLSSPGSKPVSWALGSVTLPAAPADVTPTRRRHDLPPRAGEPAFAPQPEITHTFRVEEKTVAFPKAAAGVAALVLPWGVLFSLIGKISSSLQFVTPPTMMYALFVCLVGLEALILRYWAGWRLYELLGPFIGLAVVTAYVGTVGLRAARVERLKAGGKP